MQHYPAYSTDPALYSRLRFDEKRQLRRQSNRTGLCLIAFTLLQMALSAPVILSADLRQLYQTEPVVSIVLETGIYLCSMLLPFLLAFRWMNPEEKNACNAFGKPTSALSAAAAVVACFFFCTVGDYATNLLLSFLETLGFTVNGGTYDPATNPVELFFGLLQIGVFPALVEEFALRSVVLQPMRRFGDRYAILMSAFVFSVMHGNLVQIPFAFIAGLAFGYYVVATGSIWVGVLAHFLNNAYSVILNYLVEIRPTFADTVYQIVLSVTLVFGLACIVLFWKILPHHKLQRNPSALSNGEKTAAYLLTVPMILAVIQFIAATLQLVDYIGNTNG